MLKQSKSNRPELYKKVIIYVSMFVLIMLPTGCAGEQAIESDMLKVSIDSHYPRIQEYLWKSTGAVIYGQEEILTEVLINGKAYKPEVKFSHRPDRAAYELAFSELEVTINVELKVAGNIVIFNVTKISEEGQTKVKTLEFPHQGILSVRSTQNQAQLTANRIGGRDVFINVKEASPDKNPVPMSYVILNTDQLAAALTNNTLDEWARCKYQIIETDGYKKCSVANNKWIYRELDTETAELPWAKVIITADANGDGVIDWQDGGVAQRKIIENRFGAERIRESVSHIAIDFASVAQWPFLRILDNVKKLSLYTDGFGQMLLIKGYQSEGHDSAHPDYGGNFNDRAGGVEDFNYLCRKAAEFNVDIGVHINHTEAYPEAKYYTHELVTDQNGWRWLDQSKKIDRRADTISGNLYKRLEELKKNAPDLSFVYVDVYSGKNWIEWKLGEKLNALGWPVWTEFHPHFDNYYIWTHQAGGRSKIGRFIMNHEQDTYAYDKLLKGYTHRGFMGWDAGGYERNLLQVVEKFMTQNLPTKYMQNFELLKWEDNYAKFSHNLVVKDEDGVVNMYKDDSLIASGNNIFIPWEPFQEQKIYHWNEKGGQSKWQLPKSWKGPSRVVLYQLTDLGRVHVQDLSVNNGAVQIPAQAKTPYVIYKRKIPNRKVNWSEGSPVKDMGFDSHSFDFWSKSSSSGNTENITIKNTPYGQTYLEIGSKHTGDALVSQKIGDLQGGKTYSASVWIQIEGKRQGGIRISNYGGPVVERTIDKTDFANNMPNTDKNGTNYQRVKVLFTVPRGRKSVVLSLIADKGSAGSVVMFDDVRVRPIEPTPQGDHYVFEDFENVDEGWGPFVYGYNGPCQTHISEYHEGFTDDTIEGRYSLKSMEDRYSGCVLRTLPSMLSLEPETWYTLSFDYKVENDNQYQVVIDKPFTDDRVFDDAYMVELNQKNLDNWEVVTGQAQVSSNSNKTALAVKSQGDAYLVDSQSPEVANGEYTFKVKSNQKGRCGGVIRYQSPDKLGFFGYDTGSKWVWSSGASFGTLTASGPNIENDGKFHTVKVRYVGTYFRVWIDNELVFKGALQSIPTKAGKTGFRCWFSSEAQFSDIKLAYSGKSGSDKEIDEDAKILQAVLPESKGSFTKSFKTKASADTFIALEKLNKERGMLVIDNFTIDKGKYK